jgi:hypothetical protein
LEPGPSHGTSRVSATPTRRRRGTSLTAVAYPCPRGSNLKGGTHGGPLRGPARRPDVPHGTTSGVRAFPRDLRLLLLRLATLARAPLSVAFRVARPTQRGEIGPIRPARGVGPQAVQVVGDGRALPAAVGTDGVGGQELLGHVGPLTGRVALSPARVVALLVVLRPAGRAETPVIPGRREQPPAALPVHPGTELERTHHAVLMRCRRDRRHRHKSEQSWVSERRGTNGSPHWTHGRGSCFTRRET